MKARPNGRKRYSDVNNCRSEAGLLVGLVVACAALLTILGILAFGIGIN